MIQATFRETETTREVKISGHANHAEAGKDIVCAAVSGIAFALLGYVENSGLNYVSGENEGYIEIRVFRPDDKIHAVFDMAMIGLMQVEMAHSSCITVSIDGIAKKIEKNSGIGDDSEK